MIKIIQDQKKKSPWPRTSWALKSKTKLYKSVIPRISLTFSGTVLSFWLVFIQSNRVYFPRKLFSERTSNADYTRVTWRFWTLCLTFLILNITSFGTKTKYFLELLLTSQFVCSFDILRTWWVQVLLHTDM